MHSPVLTYITLHRLAAQVPSINIVTQFRGTFNYLGESQNISKLVLIFLHDIRGMLQNINVNSPCSFPLWSVTNMLELNYK